MGADRDRSHMNLELDIQNACADAAVPSEELFSQWISAALANEHDWPHDSAEVCLRIVDAAEINALNLQYRGKDYATNVLSFPADLPAELNLPLLGDIVICSAVVEREAVEQHKVSNAHWAHMVIHGTLHLLGYDHIDDDEAEFMESREIEILSALNFPNPYLPEIDELPTATSTHQHSTECSTQNHV